MNRLPVDNINVINQQTLMTPEALKSRLPLTGRSRETVQSSRDTVTRILNRQDQRLFVVVGPCSIHDVDGALDYARRLKTLAEEVSDSLVLIMRVYFEKPRTTTGWKGFINDPHLNDSFEVEEGLHLARKLLLDLTDMGLPTSTEALDPVSPQYLQDLITWSAIGARTTESQTHREMASGLSSPIGFKNGTDGNLEVAINALKSVSTPHRFLGINSDGQVAVISTRGNPNAHIVLRGGTRGPNYDSVHVSLCERALIQAGVKRNIMIDCSHANSNKDPALQPLVMENVGYQIRDGNHSIVGLMVESNIGWGSQPIQQDRSKLKYGVSVTDACVDWPTTEQMIRGLRNIVKDVLSERADRV